MRPRSRPFTVLLVVFALLLLAPARRGSTQGGRQHGRGVSRRSPLSDRRSRASTPGVSTTWRSTRPIPAIFYAASTTGGLWKTVNNGTTWEVLFNTQDDVVGIGDVTVAQDDPNLVWVGTGGTQSWGKGVFKSTDGGKTWQAMGLAAPEVHQPHRARSSKP